MLVTGPLGDLESELEAVLEGLTGLEREGPNLVIVGNGKREVCRPTTSKMKPPRVFRFI